MRISTDPTDIGHNPQAAGLLTVLVNGVKTDRIVTADSDTGYVARYDSDGVTDDDEPTGSEGNKVEFMLPVTSAQHLSTPNFDQTAGWLQACGKKANLEDLSVQVGVHIEEVLEFLSLLSDLTPRNIEAINTLSLLAAEYKEGKTLVGFLNEEMALDALCDAEVTANGVAYLACWNKKEADRRVLAANGRKLLGGRPVILPGGKIGKPAGWEPADLSDCV